MRSKKRPLAVKKPGTENQIDRMDNERQPATALARQLEAVEVLVEKREYVKAKAELAELVNTFRPAPHTAEWAHLCYLEALEIGRAHV